MAPSHPRFPSSASGLEWCSGDHPTAAGGHWLSSSHRRRSLTGAWAGGGCLSRPDSAPSGPRRYTGAAVPLHLALLGPTCSPHTCTGPHHGAGQMTVRPSCRRETRDATRRESATSRVHSTRAPRQPTADLPVRRPEALLSGTDRRRGHAAPPRRGGRGARPSAAGGSPARRLALRRRRTHRTTRATHAADWPASQ